MADSTLALDVVKADGKKAGSVELPAALFDVKTNIPLIHQVVVGPLARGIRHVIKLQHV